jgi:hypothetical protein
MLLCAHAANAEPHIERARRVSDQRVGKQFDFGIAGPRGVSFVSAVAALNDSPIATWERLRAQVVADLMCSRRSR